MAAPLPSQLPPPAPRQAAPKNSNHRMLLIVGGVVAALLVAGGVGYLLSRGSGGDDQVALGDTPAFDIGTPPVAPAVPGAGDVPTPVTLPAPVVSPPVSAAPVPTAAPVIPTTAAPVVTAAPVDPAQPGTGPGVSTFADLGQGVLVPVPDGFKVADQNETVVYMQGAGGEITTQFVTGMSMPETISLYTAKILADFVTDLEFTAPSPIASPSASIVDRQEFIYRGAYVSNQGGSTPIEGLVNISLRTDGLIIIQDFTWPGPTPDHNPQQEFYAAAVTYLQNFVYG